MKITELFKLISETPKSSEKMKLVSDNMSDLLIKIYLDTYADRVYNIKKIYVPCSGTLTVDDNYDMVSNLLGQLERREITGNIAKEQASHVISQFTEADQKIILGIINGNLKIGFSLANFNKVKHIYEPYEAALAENIKDVKNVNVTDGSYLASQKLDGVRCHAHINYDNFMYFTSREGKTFNTLSKLCKPLHDIFDNIEHGDIVIDGEICIVDENGVEHFDKVMDEITSKNHTMETPKFKIFDIVSEAEVRGYATDGPIFSERYNLLKDLFKGRDTKYMEVVKQERIESQEDLNRWINKSRENDWEGIMLRKDAPYKKGRSKDLLKVKEMQDAEFVVTGVTKGPITIVEESGSVEIEAVTALLIQYKGNVVSVGSGLSKSQRKEWFDDPSKIIGKTITVQYFEETKDKKTGLKSLRFPILKYVYEGKREV